MNPSISYCVTACTELQELKRLLPRLIKYYVPTEDEIIIQLDTKRSDEVYQYCKMLEKDGVNIKVIEFPLSNDFAAFKNNLIAHSSKDWIANFDADELPNETLLIVLKEILFNNDDVDLFYVPRINIVNGITKEDVDRWQWKSTPEGWWQFPDFQGRIWKRKYYIIWSQSVHERLIGHENHSFLPAFDCDAKPISDYSILHVKEISRQRRQNDLYTEMSTK